MEKLLFLFFELGDNGEGELLRLERVDPECINEVD